MCYHATMKLEIFGGPRDGDDLVVEEIHDPFIGVEGHEDIYVLMNMPINGPRYVWSSIIPKRALAKYNPLAQVVRPFDDSSATGAGADPVSKDGDEVELG